MADTRARPEVFACTLVFVSDHGTSPNNPDADPMSYVRQAVTLGRSLRRVAGLGLTIVTNAPERVAAYARSLAGEHAPDVAELPVRSEVPADVPFHGAHFKLDLVEHLAATLGDDRLGLLLDSDMVALRPFDPDVLAQCARTGLGGYDITAQVSPSHGAARIFADLSRVAGRDLAEPRWFGGELLAGRADRLATLAEASRRTFETYLDVRGELAHQGDEVFVSAALAAMRRDLPIVELGAHQVVARHWSGVPLYSPDWLRACSLLHLPGEKPLLESWAGRDFDPQRFWRQLRRQHTIGAAKWQAAKALQRVSSRRAG